MHIYNSLTGTKEVLKPIKPGEVKLYVCGQTVYDYCHIGHARSMIVFDMVVRYLQSQQYNVIFVRNITDVDDKIIKRAADNNESCDALTKRFIDLMHEDEAQLHLLKPTHEPRATEYIAEIIILIEKLIAEQSAYIAGNGDVCFSIRAFHDYGKLSNRDIEKLISGARIDIAEGKKDPLDFVLWKKAKPNEPQWDSPWGSGRPGWHIECSAMATKLLGQPFDIHGGGMDLKFPHHENEIAQSESAFHTPFARIWMHAGLLNVGGEKMSKSLNNFFTIQDVLKKYSVEVIRYFMLSAHYRSPVNFSEDNLIQAQQSLSRLYTAIRGLDFSSLENIPIITPPAFLEAMNDDFNSSIAISVLFDMARDANIARKTNIDEANKLGYHLKRLAEIFGFLQTDPEVFLQGSSVDAFAQRVEKLINDRADARQNKDFSEADRIRDELQQLNVIIEDKAGQTLWRKK